MEDKFLKLQTKYSVGILMASELQDKDKTFIYFVGFVFLFERQIIFHIILWRVKSRNQVLNRAFP